MDVIHKIIQIALHISIHLSQPLPGFFIRPDKRLLRKGIALIHMMHGKELLKALPDLFILNDAVGHMDAGQVKGLGRRRAGDALNAHPAADRRDHLMAVPLRHDIAVDVIRDNGNPMPRADSYKPLQLLFLPHSPRRIVGIADKHRLCLLRNLFLQILKVHRIVAVLIFQRALRQDAPALTDYFKKGPVHRGLDDHLIPLFRHRLQSGKQAQHHIRHIADPVFLYGIIMSLLHKMNHRVIVMIRQKLIPESSLPRGQHKPPGDGRSHLKIHVRDPHRHNALLHKRRVPLVAIRILSLNSPLKTIHHHNHPFAIVFNIFKPLSPDIPHLPYHSFRSMISESHPL